MATTSSAGGLCPPERTKSVACPKPCHGRIQEAAIFEGLSPDEVNLVIGRASVRAARRGTVLFRQGEPAREMLLLQSGRMRLNEVTSDGHELLVRFIRPGEVSGDRAAIPGAKYGGFGVAQTDVRIYTWKTDTILGLIDEVPRLAANLFAIATRYLHYSRERYRLLATASVERRIRWAIRELARSIGCSHQMHTVLTSPSIQRDIADLAATTVYTVNRLLSRYERKGVLTKKRGRIVLLGNLQ